MPVYHTDLSSSGRQTLNSFSDTSTCAMRAASIAGLWSSVWSNFGGRKTWLIMYVKASCSPIFTDLAGDC